MGWAEEGGILGSRLWEAESFPTIRGGAQQEAAGAQANSGFSGVSCLLSYPRHGLGTGIKFSGAPAFNHRGLPSQVEKEALERVQNTSVQVVLEQAPEVWSLQEHPMQWEAWSMEEVEEWEMAPEGGLLWAELEVVRQREDWLANEAALGHAGILCWVWEHWVFLDGASAAFASIQDGLAQMPVGQPLELQQGMVRVGRLLAGHWQCNAVALGLWWEVVADAGEALPGLAEVLAVVWA
ncbi:hypothetical protein C0989_011711 [Termitomyces sp. Mn162]|nr:hypothetical protein C0989_011711 [Termitomyces sp. Mn162]